MTTQLRVGKVPDRLWLVVADFGEVRSYTSPAALGQALADGYWERATVHEFCRSSTDVAGVGALAVAQAGVRPVYAGPPGTPGRLNEEARVAIAAFSKKHAEWRRTVKKALIRLLG